MAGVLMDSKHEVNSKKKKKKKSCFCGNYILEAQIPTTQNHTTAVSQIFFVNFILQY